jgi:hypothetical protein
MVNRIWQGHFGEGIVRTPDNFGGWGTADAPRTARLSGPEFVQSGWSIKQMHR